MSIKKYLVGAGIVAMFVGASSLVFAENTATPQTTMMPEATMMPGSNDRQMVLEVGPNGKVLLRGTVTEVGANFLKVKSWGGIVWTITISSTTKFMPSDMSQIVVGDFVGVQGIANKDSATVDAGLVRDWTAKKVVKEARELIKKERRNNKEEIREVIKNESPKNWQGIATNINVDAKTFTLTVGGIVYTVQLVADVKIIDKMFLGTSLADVKEGDTVRVWGPLTDTTINAYVLRDVMITSKTTGSGN